MSATEQIVAIGGATAAADLALFPYLIAQARRPNPRVALLPTASGDADAFIVKFYEAFARLPCDPSYSVVPANGAIAEKPLAGERMRLGAAASGWR